MVVPPTAAAAAASPVAAPAPEGQRVGPFIISPVDRWKGTLNQGSSSNVLFTIHGDGAPTTKLTQVTTDGTAFTAKLETVEEGRRWLITATSLTSLKQGSVTDTLRIATGNSNFPELRIQLEATVDTAVMAMPKALNFGVLPISQPEFDPSRTGKFVFIRQVRGGGLEIIKVSSTLPFVKTEVRDDVKGQSYRMLVTFEKEKMTAGDHSGKIIIETNNPASPVIEITITLKAQ